MDDDALQQRLDLARQQVAEQREQLRAARRRLRENSAAASASSDLATVKLLQAKGQASPVPPVPTHLPDWLDDPSSER